MSKRQKVAYQLPSPYSPGCFIATAVYGSSSFFKVAQMREFRDNVLCKTSTGVKLVKLYYLTSPPVANFIRNRKLLKAIARYLFVEPLYFFSRFLTDSNK
jgi:hypothetical protein